MLRTSRFAAHEGSWLHPSLRLSLALALAFACAACATSASRTDNGLHGRTTMRRGTVGSWVQNLRRTTSPDPMPTPTITSLSALPSLQAQLSLLLDHHHTIVQGLAAYAKLEWQLTSGLPKGSHCELAWVPSVNDSPAHLLYLQLDQDGQLTRVYKRVYPEGQTFLVNAEGDGYRVLDPVQPVRNARISSGWGWRTQPVLGGREFHHGIDYAVPPGAPVHAALAGTVRIAHWHGRYGRMVEIEDAGGYVTRYGHLHGYAPGIHSGTKISQGEVIAYVGSTGLSTGPHLYYEVWKNGKRINPLTHPVLLVAAQIGPDKSTRLVDDGRQLPLAP
ncbi:MAG: M23 family metallopeptidase [Gammaproteobacteria bacterium]